jgi:hypothetical protein
MKSPWLLVLLVLGCTLPACRERDAQATAERILRTGTMRVGLAANPAERSYREVVLLQQVAAQLGARVEIFPAPIPDLEKALAAGVIDVIVLRPAATGRGAAAAPEQASGGAVARLDFSLEGDDVALLIRKGENRFLAICRRELEEAARTASGKKSRPAASP